MKRLLLLLCSLLSAAGCSGTRPPNVNQPMVPLAPCPHSPNCISSLSHSQAHTIDPLHYQGTQLQAQQRLLAVIEAYPRSRLITVTQHYIYAEFSSAVFGFVDDVEFRFRFDAAVIDVRSASRLGYSDFGANRKRIETLRQQLNH